MREVVWNPGRVEVGSVAGVADGGGEVLVVGDQGAFFFSGGVLTGTDRRASRWRGAAPIPAAEGKGTWLAAIDQRGSVFRAKAGASLEDVSDRYGLTGTPVLGLTPIGAGSVGFALLGGRIAVADGRMVTTLSGGPAFDAGQGGLSGTGQGGLSGTGQGGLSGTGQGGLSGTGQGGLSGTGQGGLSGTGQGSLSEAGPPISPGVGLVGGGGRVAWIEDAGVRVLRSAKNEVWSFEIAGVRRIAMDDRGRLFAATNHAIYAQNEAGALMLVHETESPRVTVTGLAASGSRVWFTEGAELGVIERLSGANDGTSAELEGVKPLREGPIRVAITRGFAGETNGRPTGTPPGDVWRLASDRLIGASSGDVWRLASDRLIGASSGDVWRLTGGRLTRVAVRPVVPRPTKEGFIAAVGPIFQRACASCHGPKGSSGIDLSTFEAWESHRAPLRLRVIEARDMPPRSQPLPEGDREILDAWTADPADP